MRLLMIVIVLGLTGCGGAAEETPVNETTTSSSAGSPTSSTNNDDTNANTTDSSSDATTVSETSTDTVATSDDHSISSTENSSNSNPDTNDIDDTNINRINRELTDSNETTSTDNETNSDNTTNRDVVTVEDEPEDGMTPDTLTEDAAAEENPFEDSVAADNDSNTIDNDETLEQIGPAIAGYNQISVYASFGGNIVGTGIDCRNDCQEYFQNEDTITLEAEPIPGYLFTGWRGDCAGMDTCEITLSANRVVYAEFEVINTAQCSI